MAFQAKDVEGITFPTERHGYSERAVDQFVDQVKETLRANEAALAAARDPAGPAGDPVPVAARLLELAQTAADEQLADARAHADRLLADARAEADRQVAEAREQAAATRSEAEQSAARILLDARHAEAQILAHVEQLRTARQSSRAGLRQLAHQLISTADSTEADPAADGHRAAQ
jgi:DivIVA domain-containing protein